MSHKRKIALVFTGGVSLGSFEAGVAYEIIRHVFENRDPQIEIDVIVGASAGALTGALTALTLVFGTDPGSIEEAWLEVKLEDLLALSTGDKSLLSSSKVDSLIKKYIWKPSSELMIHSGAFDSISFAAVVTNLDGIRYKIHTVKGNEFSIGAVGYEDALKFRIGKDFAQWAELRDAIRASSAFPVAFEPKKIVRSEHDFPRVSKYNFALGVSQKSYHYSDGGIVNNQPLSRAIEMVNYLPASNPEEDFERVFLVIDPAPPGEQQETEQLSPFDVAARAVWTIPRNQTLYKDLLLLEKVNRRITWKNSFVSTMADLWNNFSIPEQKAAVLDGLSKEVARFKGEKILGMDSAQYLRSEQERIRNAYKKELGRVKNRDLFIKYCYLLEQVADLRNKREITVEMISPMDAEKELAGVIFGNFGGFLSSGFMKHDYNVGRTYAKRWLKKETELKRLVVCSEERLPVKINRKIIQQLFDNSVPLLVEDLKPRLLGLKADLPGEEIGRLTLLRMFTLSLMKYAVKKSFNWARQKVMPREPLIPGL